MRASHEPGSGRSARILKGRGTTFDASRVLVVAPLSAPLLAPLASPPSARKSSGAASVTSVASRRNSMTGPSNARALKSAAPCASRWRRPRDAATDGSSNAAAWSSTTASGGPPTSNRMISGFFIATAHATSCRTFGVK